MLFHYNDFPRFWSKVGIGSPDKCWPWMTGQNGNGYGFFNEPRQSGRKRRNTVAHRVAYELLVGPIPDGLTLDHLCRQTLCVNPRHLEPVSHITNTMRGFSPMANNARKTHCVRGHEFSPENTLTRRKGDRHPSRECRTCKRNRERTRSSR